MPQVEWKASDYLIQFGRNTDIDTGEEDIWDGGGTWVAPTQSRIHDLVSTSTNDTSVGTGARTVLIEGLDSVGQDLSEVVTLNGTSNVATTGSYLMINRMTVATAGSGGANVGDITATAQTDSTVTAQISAGNNRTMMAIYKLPDYTGAFLRECYGSLGVCTSGTIATVKLYVKGASGLFDLRQTFGVIMAGAGAYRHSFGEWPLVLDKGATLKLSAEVNSDNTEVMAGLTITFRR